MTAAGAAVDIDANYTSGELFEFRTTVSAWTGVAGSFKGYYFQTQATTGNATYGLRDVEMIGTANITSGTTGLGNLQTLYVEANLKHGTASWTLGGYGAAIEATTCIYAGAGTLTVTNDFPAIKVKVQGANGAADYTKFNGISVYARDGDSAARVFGDAISIEDPADGFASDWTTAINITAGCTTGLNIAGSTKGMSVISTLTGTSNLDANTITVTDNTTAGAYIRGLAIGVTAAGAKTGSGEADGLGIDMTYTGNTVYGYNISLYGAGTGNPTLGFV
jgi:hypothetical protein